MNCKKALLLMVCLFFIICFAESRAQLLISDKKHKVVKIDEVKNRIEITGIDDAPDRTLGYIYVDGNTKCLKNGEPLGWKHLKKGWIIQVRGGVRFDANVNAREIIVLKTN